MACPFRSMLPSGSVSAVYFGGMTLNGTKRGKIFAAGAGEGTLWYSCKDRQEQNGSKTDTDRQNNL